MSPRKKTAPAQKPAAAKDFSALAKEKINQEIDNLGKLLSTAKTKLDKMDDQTKKKITLGVAGAAALIASVVGAKKMSKKIKKQ
ncbi:MAG TPA: hypothetical protein PLR18_03260 [bacterium]|nr:hypothetical protein [bacterium]